MNKSEVLSGFNNHIHEFFNDVSVIFPDNTDIRIAQASLGKMRKANPKLIMEIWREFIADKYRDEIATGNIDFFLTKNYTSDLKGTDNAREILEKINSLREPIKSMGKDNLNKTITYIQNLTKICDMYHK